MPGKFEKSAIDDSDSMSKLKQNLKAVGIRLSKKQAHKSTLKNGKKGKQGSRSQVSKGNLHLKKSKSASLLQGNPNDTMDVQKPVHMAPTQKEWLPVLKQAKLL